MPISRRIFLYGSAAAAAVLLTGYKSNSSSVSDGVDFKLRVAETTDVHGNIFPYNFATGSDKKTNSLAHIYSFVESERERIAKTNDKEYFMLVDNGDNLQGEPILNIYNDGIKDGSKNTHIVPDALNYMGYELSVVGNHDVEPGKKLYDYLSSAYNFPLLSANAVRQGTQTTTDPDHPGDGSHQPYFANDKSNGAYIIKTIPVKGKRDIKVAFLGLSTPESKVFLKSGDLNSDIYFEDMVESAAYWMEKIKAESPDLIIGMCHAGYEYTLTPGQDENTYRNYNPVQLIAQNVPGFDILFWGHDHIIKEEVTINGTVLLGGNHYAQQLSIADIEFTYDSSTDKYNKKINGSYLQIKDTKDFPAGTLVDESGKYALGTSLTKIAASSDFMTQFKSVLNDTKTLFSKTIIGTLTTTLNTKDAVFGDSAFNDLVHNLEKYAAKKEFDVDVDMTIAAPLKYSFGQDSKGNDIYDLTGKLTYADMWNLYFYDNLHAVIEMTGQEVKNYLEYTVGVWYNHMMDKNDDLLALKSAEDAHNPKHMKTKLIYWNMDTVAGIVYEVDVSKAAGSRVTIKGIDSDYDGSVDGTFELSKKYKISVNSYRYGGGGGHFKAIGIDSMSNRTLFYSATGLRDYLISYIQDKNDGTIAPRAIGQWKVVPEAWAAKGRLKDDSLVFWSGATGR